MKNAKRNRSAFSYCFLFNNYIQFTGLCTYLPVRFPKNAYLNEKEHIVLICSFCLVPP